MGTLNVLEAAPRRKGRARVVFAASGGSSMEHVDRASLPVNRTGAASDRFSPTEFRKCCHHRLLEPSTVRLDSLEFQRTGRWRTCGPRQNARAGKPGVVASFAARLAKANAAKVKGTVSRREISVFVDDVRRPRSPRSSSAVRVCHETSVTGLETSVQLSSMRLWQRSLCRPSLPNRGPARDGEIRFSGAR